MTAPLARARTALLAGAALSAAALVGWLGAGTSTAAPPVQARAYGPPTSWTPPDAPPVRWLPPARALLGVPPLPRLTPPGPALPVGRPPVAGPPGVIGPGSLPAQVRSVQRLLNAAGARLRVDGDWGPATTRAVRTVQLRAGLAADGRVGPATAAVLRRR